VLEIEDAERDELDQALIQLERVDVPFAYLLLERNFVELATVHQFAVLCVSLGSQFSGADRRRLVESVMNAMVNWLTALRLYLDHTETDLKRRFSDEGPQVIRFLSACRAAYDDHLGYRFMYRLRNYVQHCGLPTCKLTIDRPTGRVHPKAVQHARLLLDRDALLHGYKKWSTVQMDIQEMSPYFPLMPLAEDAMDGLRTVQNTNLRIEVDEALRAVPTVDAALKRLYASTPPEAGLPCLVTTEGTPGHWSNLSPRPIRSDLVRVLADAAADGRDADSVISSPPATQVETLSRLDPRAVAGRFHADSRGVQILRTWFEEGGASPRFMASIDSMIAADGTAEPVVMGLVNVSIVLAHMAASALGASTEALVTKIMERYALEDDSTSHSPRLRSLAPLWDVDEQRARVAAFDDAVPWMGPGESAALEHSELAKQRARVAEFDETQAPET
jgi:hypothetical protein